MKKFLVFLAAILLVFGMAGTSAAVPITFTDTTGFTSSGTDPFEDLDDYGWGHVDFLDGSGDYVQWTHHFEFDPPADQVLSGTLALYLYDDDDDPGWFPWEFALGWAEDGTWDYGEVNTGNYLYDVTASYLEDGTFQVTLVDLWGDFGITRSDLSVTYAPAAVPEPTPEPTPEPATVLLMGAGLGLFGLGALCRKKLCKA